MTDKQSSTPEADQREQKGRGFLGVIQSVLAAMFGVQSENNREKDFNEGKPGDYIVVGIVMVILFILTLIWVVNSILESSQI